MTTPAIDEAMSRGVIGRDEERALGRRIAAGRSAQARLDEGGVDADGGLSAAAADGERAVQQLTLAHLRFVMTLARRGRRKADDIDVAFAAGCIGLQMAARRYDPSYEGRFIAYAKSWIWREIRREFSQRGASHAIRVPEHSYQAAMAARRLEASGATPAEVAAEMRLRGVPEDQVADARAALAAATRLDAPRGEDTNTTVIDVLIDGSAVDPLAEAIAADRCEYAHTLLAATLSARERYIVERVYGVNGPEMTMAQIGETLGVSKQRVQQVLVRAIDKLRSGHDRAERTAVMAA